MAEAFVERRRSPRIVVTGNARLDRPTALSVRLIDISLGGVLMSSSQPFAKGQYGRLSARLGDVPIDVDIEVRRTSRERDGKDQHKVGARFVGLDNGTREAMHRFLTSTNR